MRYRKGMCLAGCLVLMIAMVLTACGERTTDGKVIEEAASVESGYRVYKIKKDCTAIDSEEYRFQSQTSVDLVGECLDALCKTEDNKHYEKLLPGDVQILDYDYDDQEKQANIYFNEAYKDLESSHEVLCRAAIVMTLTQFSGVVDYVQFYIDGEPMKDSNGRDMLMMASDFEYSTSADLKDLNEETLKLYFSSTDGHQLVLEEVHVRYYNTSPVERVVMESLRSGPMVDGHLRTMPASTKLNSVTVEDGLCTVDLNQRFLEKIEGQKFAVKVYSVVNSLCQVEGIDRVQILIDGQIVDYEEQDLSIREPLTANEDLVIKNAENVPVLETVDESQITETETAEESK